MTYKKADEITGKVMARLKEGDTLFVLSDHGGVHPADQARQ